MLLFNLNMKNLFMLFVVSVSPSVSELSKKCGNVCPDKTDIIFVKKFTQPQFLAPKIYAKKA